MTAKLSNYRSSYAGPSSCMHRDFSPGSSTCQTQLEAGGGTRYCTRTQVGMAAGLGVTGVHSVFGSVLLHKFQVRMHEMLFMCSGSQQRLCRTSFLHIQLPDLHKCADQPSSMKHGTRSPPLTQSAMTCQCLSSVHNTCKQCTTETAHKAAWDFASQLTRASV